MAVWWEDRVEVAAVGRMLVDVDYLVTAAEVLDFVEKPWKWAEQRDAWVGAQRPKPEDASWGLFVARVERSDRGER